MLLLEIAAVHQRRGEYSKALEYFEKRANMDANNKEAWYLVGVNCWARSYHGGPDLSQSEREQVVDKGVKAFEKALAIDPDYFEGLAYMNLVYREKAKALAAVGRSAEAREAYAQADEYQQRAIEIHQKLAAKLKVNAG